MLALVNVLGTCGPLAAKQRPERVLYNMVRPFCLSILPFLRIPQHPAQL